jgi:apolipoprotein N-acyltransferase
MNAPLPCPESVPVTADQPRVRRGVSWLEYLAALGAGALAPLAFAPFHLFVLSILSLSLLFVLWLRAEPRRALWLGWLFGLGMFAIGASWVYISIEQFGGVGLPLAVVITAVFVAAMALYPAFVGYLGVRFLCRSASLALLAGFPALWVLGEWVRGWFLSGFPWLNLGYSQVDAPLGGLAPVLGVYGVSWAAASTSGLLALTLVGSPRARVMAVLGILGLWLAGAALDSRAWTEPAGAPVRVALLQGNVEQRIKWAPEERRRTVEIYTRLTRSHWHTDLIVWPETAVPMFLHQAQEDFLGDLVGEAQEHHTDLLVGIPILDAQGGHYYNGMVSLGATPGAYRKRHLVPFGEYLPLQSLLGRVLDFLEIPMSDFSAGSREKKGLLLVAAGLPIGPSMTHSARRSSPYSLRLLC